MSNVVERIIEVAGQDFDSPDCRVNNPRITARESIEIADYIVALKAERDALLEAIETALNGTKLDEFGNRDDDGLYPWGSTVTATRVLKEALRKYAKAGAV